MPLRGVCSDMAFRLEGTAGTWILPVGDTVIGRGDDCGVRLSDPRLSRHHARLDVMPPHVVVHDLGSANGVLVNGDRIAAPTALMPGDEVVCGPLRVRLRSDEERSPSRVHSQPVTETLRGLIGEPAGNHPQRSGTEQMDGELVAREVANSRNPARQQALSSPSPSSSLSLSPSPSPSLSRSASSANAAPPKPASKLNPAIAAAVSAEGEAPGERREGSTSIRPSEMVPAIGSTSALLPNRFHAPSAPLSPHGTAHLMPSEAPSHASAALEAGRNLSPSHKPLASHQSQPLPSPLAKRSLRGARLLAGIADPLWVALLSLAVGMVVVVFGVTASLAFAGAGIAHGDIEISGAPRASVAEVLAYVMSPANWSHLDALARQLHAQTSPWPFLAFFFSLALGAVVTELLVLWALVAASVYRGGPWLHRRLGLHLVVRRNGHHPGWLRGIARWTFLTLTWPAAIVTAAIGVRGVHDVLCGCEMRLKR